MQWANCEIKKVREDTVRRNLVGAKNIDSLGALGKLDLGESIAIRISQLIF